MTVRNLEFLFKPHSIALIGASERPSSVGEVLGRNLFHSGFEGPVMPVNPKHPAIEGVLAYPDVDHLPVVPELAVISTPPEAVPGIVAALGRRGTKAAVVITAGFGEGEDRVGADLRQRVLDAAKPHLLRVIGPNCLGILVPGIKLNASFAHVSPRAGDLAFVAQSGAMVTAVLDWARPRGIGFSHLVSLGDMVDVDFGDMLDYLASDPGTRAILLYIEGVTHARKFMSAARSAARSKPVVVVKAGRRPEGAKAASSHTGAMAGSDAVYDAAIQRAGMLRVYEFDELFDAVETLALCRPSDGDRLAILTNGGGIGVMATDSLIEQGGHLASLAPETIAALDKVLPRTWSHGNPVDIIGDAPPERYKAAYSALAGDPTADAVLVLNCPTAVASSTDAAKAVIGAAKGRSRNLFTSWVGESAVAESRRLFAEAGIPTYATPNHAVRAFMHMVRYRRNQNLLIQVPPSIPEAFAPDKAKVRALIASALAEGREWLTEPEAKEVLDAYSIPAIPTKVARTPEEAARLAAAFEAPCALKILSLDITHKSDAGGVVLNLATPDEVRAAAETMKAKIAASHPKARLEGFTVEPMARTPRADEGAYELIVGMTVDAQFGPVILFGHGGIGAEVISDKALALAPLNMMIARDLMTRTRIYKLLQGFRHQSPVALDAVALTLVKISQLAVDFAEVAELDINPLYVDSSGVMALDARVKIRPARGEGTERLAIRPYPSELEEAVTLPDGRHFVLRPVRPEDAPSIVDFFEHLSPEDVRLRFFAPLKALSPAFLARLTQIDYEREMAFVLCPPAAADGKARIVDPEILAVVRIVADPDNEQAEYAIVVRTDLKGHGLGQFLMERIIAYATARGIRRIYGDVLRENANMLNLCHALGFKQSNVPGEAELVLVELDLMAARAAAGAKAAAAQATASSIA
ncbi:MAG TPA: bifunctional acetate--CoA ligase family protein/GNAT family N-acetyltransferase [Alphaproteobacteria bacterium]|nr:bifunctional acetate--CoA ligase family protein/GNAT family N-acetyltransferase [Alphaproteobacteria bacterium]